MKLSYALPVWNEHEELKRLLTFLQNYIEDSDEIVVQCDKGNTTPEVYKVLSEFNNIKVIEFPLNRDFASFKNNLKDQCTGEWIVQLDSDELPHINLIQNLKTILQENPNIELFLVPRINIVEGLTQEHSLKWGWRVNEKEWVNFPDYQTRILQNTKKIKWTGKVHETIIGHSNYSLLPTDEEWCLYHSKTIERQEKQNNFYNKLDYEK